VYKSARFPGDSRPTRATRSSRACRTTWPARRSGKRRPRGWRRPRRHCWPTGAPRTSRPTRTARAGRSCGWGWQQGRMRPLSGTAHCARLLDGNGGQRGTSTTAIAIDHWRNRNSQYSSYRWQHFQRCLKERLESVDFPRFFLLSSLSLPSLSVITLYCLYNKWTEKNSII
jgi:hypothetical protein